MATPGLSCCPGHPGLSGPWGKLLGAQAGPSSLCDGGVSASRSGARLPPRSLPLLSVRGVSGAWCAFSTSFSGNSPGQLYKAERMNQSVPPAPLRPWFHAHARRLAGCVPGAGHLPRHVTLFSGKLGGLSVPERTPSVFLAPVFH